MPCRGKTTYAVNGGNKVARLEFGARRWRHEAQRGADRAVCNIDHHKSRRKREESNDEPNATRRGGAGRVRGTDGANVGECRLEHFMLTVDMHDGPDGLGLTG